MKSHFKNSLPSLPGGLLPGASGLALILGLINSAVAADLSITIAPPVSDVTGIVINSGATHPQQTRQLQVNTITGTLSGVPFNENPADPGITVNANALLSSARSNVATSQQDQSSLGNNQDFSIATAQMTRLLNQTVTAEINSPLVTLLFAAPVQSATVSANSAIASTVVNQALAHASQDDLAGFATPVPDGMATVDGDKTDPDALLETKANASLANFQRAVNASGPGSQAKVQNAAIKLDMADPSSGLDGEIHVVDNEIGAAYISNESRAAYEGGHIDMNGSIVIASLQENFLNPGVQPTVPTASLADSGVLINAGNHALGGHVVLSGQQLSASSSGNVVDHSLELHLSDTMTGNASNSLELTSEALGASVGASVEYASLGIANAQRNLNAGVESEISNSNLLITGSGSTAGSGQLLLDDNTARSAAFGNTARNDIGVLAGTLKNAGLGIANAQLNQNTAVHAANTSNMLVSGVPAGAAALTHSGEVVLAQNRILSEAGGSSADNRISSTIPLVDAGSQAGTHTVSATQAGISNRQFSEELDVRAETVGNIAAILQSDAMGLSSSTALVFDNSEQSRAIIHSVNNEIDLHMGVATDLATSIFSEQTASNSNVYADTQGRIAVAMVGAKSGSPIDVTGNALGARAGANDAHHQLSLLSDTDLHDTGTASQVVLENRQTAANHGLVSSRLEGMAAILANGLLDDANVLDNVLLSVAMVNTADSRLSAAAQGSLSAGELRLSNSQSSSFDAKADARGRFYISTIDIQPGVLDVDGTTTVQGNSLAASAGQNYAQNGLSLSADTTAGVPANVQLNNEQMAYGRTQATASTGSAGLGVAATAGGGVAGVSVVSNNRVSSWASANAAENTAYVAALHSNAGASLQNSQMNQGEVLATSTLNGGLGIHALGGGDLTGSAIVRDNQLQSQAQGNDAENRLDMQALATLASGQLQSSQSNTAGVTSRVDMQAGLGVSFGGASANAAAIMAGNQIRSQAFGNRADNALNAVSTAAALNADLGLDNFQSNSGPVSAFVSGLPGAGNALEIGLSAPSASGFTATIAANAIVARAYGNTAENRLSASSPLAGGTGTYALTSSQLNTGDVKASVTGAGMGVVGYGSGSAGASVISSNSVLASAVGNASTSYLSVGR